MSKILITHAGKIVIITDGKHTRQSICSTPRSAKLLETRLKNDRSLALRWLKATEPVQLEMNFETTDDHGILESKD